MTQSKPGADTSLRLDLCVIGGGDAGFSAAIAGVALGLSVTLIEQDVRDETLRMADVVVASYGRAGRRAQEQASDERGRHPFDMGVFRKGLIAHLRDAVPDLRLARLAAMNVLIFRGHARFADGRTVVVGDARIRARRFVLATGLLRPEAPSGASSERFITPDTLQDLHVIPDHLIVVGQDSDAIAVAQSIRRFGAPVTLIASAGLLPRLDPEHVGPVRSRVLAEHISLHEGAERPLITWDQNRPTIIWADGTRTHGSHLFCGQGKEPALADLGLDRAGIRTDAAGLVVSGSLRTTNARVFAIGAVAGAGSPQAAQAQVSVAMKAAFLRLPARYRPAAVPVCTETAPQIASVGLSEAEARASGPVRVWRWPFAETYEGRARGDTVGHVKVVTDTRGRVLGAGIVGDAAAEQIGFWALAVQARIGMQALAEVSLPVPSLSEASRRAVVAHAADRLQGRWMKRALALMKRLG